MLGIDFMSFKIGHSRLDPNTYIFISYYKNIMNITIFFFNAIYILILGCVELRPLKTDSMVDLYHF